MRGPESPPAEGLRIGWPAIARAAQVSPSTAQRMAARGELPVVRVGRRVWTTDAAIVIYTTAKALGVDVSLAWGMLQALYKRSLQKDTSPR